MKRTVIRRIRGLLATGVLATWAAPAFAQATSSGGLGQVLTNVRTDTLGPVGDFLGGGSFILGVIFAIMAILKLVQNHRNPHDPTSKPAQAIIFGIAAAALIAIPSFLGMGVTTFFGSGAQTTSVTGTLRSIN